MAQILDVHNLFLTLHFFKQDSEYNETRLFFFYLFKNLFSVYSGVSSFLRKKPFKLFQNLSRVIFRREFSESNVY